MILGGVEWRLIPNGLLLVSIDVERHLGTSLNDGVSYKVYHR